MRKKVLTSLLAMGVLLGCLTTQVEAEEGCDHSYDKIEVSRTVTEGYNHTYTNAQGTQGCAVTKGTYTYEVKCSKSGHVSETGSGTFESHSTDHT